VDLRISPSDDVVRANGFNLEYVIDAYRNLNENTEMGDAFFTAYFDTLVGVDYVREMIIRGKDAAQIAETWQEELEDFKAKRTNYLIYPE
jgi:uncharacterized protein YbbC (DUF1343 family)